MPVMLVVSTEQYAHACDCSYFFSEQKSMSVDVLDDIMRKNAYACDVYVFLSKNAHACDASCFC